MDLKFADSVAITSKVKRKIKNIVTIYAVVVLQIKE